MALGTESLKEWRGREDQPLAPVLSSEGPALESSCAHKQEPSVV